MLAARPFVVALCPLSDKESIQVIGQNHDTQLDRRRSIELCSSSKSKEPRTRQRSAELAAGENLRGLPVHVDYRVVYIQNSDLILLSEEGSIYKIFECEVFLTSHVRYRIYPSAYGELKCFVEIQAVY
jgi:hypothetical protein